MVYIQATYTPVLDQAGKTTAVVKFAVDVTAAVEAKHADQKLQQLYLQMVENTSVRLIVANREGTITYMNPASLEALRKLERYLPCRADEIVGRSFDIFHKRPEHQRNIVADPKNLPHRTTFPLGDEWLDLTASALRARDGTFLGPLVTWEVITEQVRAKEKEQEQQQQIMTIKDDLEQKVK